MEKPHILIFIDCECLYRQLCLAIAVCLCVSFHLPAFAIFLSNAISLQSVDTERRINLANSDYVQVPAVFVFGVL